MPYCMVEKPQMVIVGGPPLYLSKHKVSQDLIDSALKNLETIVEHVPLTIVDHHVLRDENWREKLQTVFKKESTSGNKVITAAEFLSENNVLLEANRKEIYLKEPPDQEFKKWTKLPLQKRRCIEPPKLV